MLFYTSFSWSFCRGVGYIHQSVITCVKMNYVSLVIGCSSCITCALLIAVNSNSHYPICSYVPNPVLVIIDVQPKELGIPTKAYYAVEEVKEVCLGSEKLECFT